MTPQQMLKKTQHMERSMNAMLSKGVKVGLPEGSAASAAYSSGVTVLEVGTWHEYGFGFNPQRSWLRLPFRIKRDDLAGTIDAQWADVVEGKDVDAALGLIGVKAKNISVGAFQTGGYGQWPDISDAQKEAKGSSRILFDQGILSGSITWVVE